MTSAPTAKLIAPGAGKRVQLFGVRFDYKVVSADSGGSLTLLEVEIPAGTLVKPHNHTREDEFSWCWPAPWGCASATACWKPAPAPPW
jgi:hypothetical protein